MKSIVVRYQAKPERADENQKLIEAVFAELDERQPEGFTYKVYRLEDGVSFVHVVRLRELGVRHGAARVASSGQSRPTDRRGRDVFMINP